MFGKYKARREAEKTSGEPVLGLSGWGLVAVHGDEGFRADTAILCLLQRFRLGRTSRCDPSSPQALSRPLAPPAAFGCAVATGCGNVESRGLSVRSPLVDCVPQLTAPPPDLQTQLEALLNSVWTAEADWRFDDRLDLSLHTPTPKRRDRINHS